MQGVGITDPPASTPAPRGNNGAPDVVLSAGPELDAGKDGGKDGGKAGATSKTLPEYMTRRIAMFEALQKEQAQNLAAKGGAPIR